MSFGKIKDIEDREGPKISGPKSMTVIRHKVKVVQVDVFSQKIYEKIQKISKPENSAEYVEFLKDTINRIVVFKHLTENEVECMISNMFYCEAIPDKNYIFKQMSEPSCCLIIDQGVVSVEINGIGVKNLKRGDYFGEKALLFNKLRSACIRVVERPLFMWAIDKTTFRSINEKFGENKYLARRKYIETVK